MKITQSIGSFFLYGFYLVAVTVYQRSEDVPYTPFSGYLSENSTIMSVWDLETTIDVHLTGQKANSIGLAEDITKSEKNFFAHSENTIHFEDHPSASKKPFPYSQASVNLSMISLVFGLALLKVTANTAQYDVDNLLNFKSGPSRSLKR
ncbi:hypothetical protein ACO2Q8_07450 [Larkinella sp. VNQ87]|uniref:hypothetical protein n=1 Tax=Larkinella sp. VNQ87 TaxID=3400921 RepID=UPI003C04851D